MEVPARSISRDLVECQSGRRKLRAAAFAYCRLHALSGALLAMCTVQSACMSAPGTDQSSASVEDKSGPSTSFVCQVETQVRVQNVIPNLNCYSPNPLNSLCEKSFLGPYLGPGWPANRYELVGVGWAGSLDDAQRFAAAAFAVAWSDASFYGVTHQLDGQGQNARAVAGLDDLDPLEGCDSASPSLVASLRERAAEHEARGQRSTRRVMVERLRQTGASVAELVKLLWLFGSGGLPRWASP